MKAIISFKKISASLSDALNMIPDIVGYDLSILCIRLYTVKILSDLCKGILFSDPLILKSCSECLQFTEYHPTVGSLRSISIISLFFYISSFYISLNPPTWVKLLCTYTMVIAAFNSVVQPSISSSWRVNLVVPFYIANWTYTIRSSEEPLSKDRLWHTHSLWYRLLTFMLLHHLGVDLALRKQHWKNTSCSPTKCYWHCDIVRGVKKSVFCAYRQVD